MIAELSGGYDADDQVRNYYDTANRLRATQHYLDVSTGVDHGTFDEYEYDALGRRIVVISRRNDPMPACHPSIQLCIQSICNQQATCNSSFTRYAWDGNQTLVEDRLPFGSASYGSDDGYVTYVHGAELDQPLGVIDTRVTGNLRVPHPTWRGMYESSSTASGAPADCSLTTNTCTLVAWNATNSLYKLDAPGDTHVTYSYTWVGGLLMNQQDASGLLYRRNRYYDPMSGRFTQEDPVGLDGGLNTYGFGEGDPVNYSDPFGLCAFPKDPRPCSQVWNGFGYAHGGWLGGHVGLGDVGKMIDAMEWTYHHSGAPADEKVEPSTTPAETSPPASPAEGPTDTPKNPDGSHKERGQRYEEISDAQRKNRQRGQPHHIERTDKSRQRDRQETRDEAEEALEQLRQERKNPPKKEEEKKP
ncbi:MAG TPA: RHS repeat-associated core domain-containing protein [Gemmatimonadaceae bacterium]